MSEERVGKVEFLIDTDRAWSREDAEVHIQQLLDAAKSGVAQRVDDRNGTFDITYRPRVPRKPINDVLRGATSKMA
jgi:hypothetical protein